MPTNDYIKSLKINYNPGVTQITYLMSLKEDAYGQTWKWPANAAGAKITLVYRTKKDETPDPKNPVKLNLHLEDLDPDNKGLWGLFMTNQLKDPHFERQHYGRVVAHELGHVMALMHRGLNEDSIPAGDFRNLMFLDSLLRNAADFDLIQLRGMRQSSALKD